VHHAAAVAIHDPNPTSLTLIFTCGDQVLSIRHKEIRPNFERVVVDRVAVAGEAAAIRGRSSADDWGERCGQMSPSRASLEQSSPLGNDPRLDLRAAPEHVERHCKTIGEGGLGSEAEPLGAALRIADRDPHLAATRGTAMHDEF
jgi:hypothetical protein